MTLQTAGARLHGTPLPQDEDRLRQLTTDLQIHGSVLLVDPPAAIGTLPVAVARDRLPGRLPARAGDAPGRRPAPAEATSVADRIRELLTRIHPAGRSGCSAREVATPVVPELLTRLAAPLAQVLVQRRAIAEAGGSSMPTLVPRC